jgi:hypothetical protein
VDADADADADADLEADADAEAEALADADLLVDAVLVAGCAVEEPPPAGDGVWVTGWVAEPDVDVSGVGVKVDGTEEPPAVQAEIATASRTAPAARRPAVSHASRDGAAGVLSRMFMDPPRTRVRYTR